MLISVIFDSGYGHTAKQAQAVAEGARQVHGTEVKLIAVGDGDIPWETLALSDAIVLGSPTYNGTISARLKQFMEDSTRPAWLPQAWRNKLAAGFTNSGAMHGDKLNALITMALFAAQQGMVWVGLDLFPGKTPEDKNRVGGWLGAMAQSDDASPEITPPASDLETAAHLGRRVALLARQLRAGASALQPELESA
jgi:NAD(P)H dehydrogenase (quinone)